MSNITINGRELSDEEVDLMCMAIGHIADISTIAEDRAIADKLWAEIYFGER